MDFKIKVHEIAKNIPLFCERLLALNMCLNATKWPKIGVKRWKSQNGNFYLAILITEGKHPF